MKPPGFVATDYEDYADDATGVNSENPSSGKLNEDKPRYQFQVLSSQLVLADE